MLTLEFNMSNVYFSEEDTLEIYEYLCLIYCFLFFWLADRHLKVTSVRVTTNQLKPIQWTLLYYLCSKSYLSYGTGVLHFNAHLWHSTNASNKYCTLLKGVWCHRSLPGDKKWFFCSLFIWARFLFALASGKIPPKPAFLGQSLQTSRIRPIQVPLTSPRKPVPLNATPACTRMLSLQKDRIWSQLFLTPCTLGPNTRLGSD